MHFAVFAFLLVSVTGYPINDELLLPFSIIGDMDSLSRDGDIWYSPMSIGTLALNANRTTAFVHWTSSHNYTSKLNYDNRGMELSDLKYYNGKLMAVEDKTGVIYWLWALAVCWTTAPFCNVWEAFAI
ncbi:hypothetical protein RB195_025619 [Necator americanus]|uniref:Bee-milk protein n=1 Tax=Necator americanus TaxID=51031 RepID=A0ABR1ET54_NECAM